MGKDMAHTTPSGGVPPYLTVGGAARAIDFYKTVFGAEELGRHMAEDGRRIMHCALRINGGTVMLADSITEHGDYPPPDPGRGSPVSISLALADPGEVDRLHRRALDNGASWTPWTPAGAGIRHVQDPFGHRWMLNAEKGQKV
jgi:PhnB protein